MTRSAPVKKRFHSSTKGSYEGENTHHELVKRYC